MHLTLFVLNFIYTKDLSLVGENENIFVCYSFIPLKYYHKYHCA